MLIFFLWNQKFAGNDGCCSPRSPLSPKSPGIYDILKVSDGQKEYYDANLKNQYNEGKDNEAEEWVAEKRNI